MVVCLDHHDQILGRWVLFLGNCMGRFSVKGFYRLGTYRYTQLHSIPIGILLANGFRYLGGEFLCRMLLGGEA